MSCQMSNPACASVHLFVCTRAWSGLVSFGRTEGVTVWVARQCCSDEVTDGHSWTRGSGWHQYSLIASRPQMTFPFQFAPHLSRAAPSSTGTAGGARMFPWMKLLMALSSFRLLRCFSGAFTGIMLTMSMIMAIADHTHLFNLHSTE